MSMSPLYSWAYDASQIALSSGWSLQWLRRVRASILCKFAALTLRAIIMCASIFDVALTCLAFMILEELTHSFVGKVYGTPILVQPGRNDQLLS